MILKSTPKEAAKVKAPVDGRIMYSEKRTEVILLTLAPGQSLPEHQNPFDVLFIGITGTAIMTTGETLTEISPGETIFVSADEQRAWHNPSQGPCRVMVVKILQGPPA
ncbi:MAG: cupin domain-containing protein [Bacteroidales bacterium]